MSEIKLKMKKKYLNEIRERGQIEENKEGEKEKEVISI